MESKLSRAYDAVLIVRFQAGCDRALEELILRHSEAVRRSVVRRIGGDSCVVDDVCQEIWIQVINSLPKMREPIAWQKWLMRVAQRQVALFLRRKKRPLVPMEAVFDELDAIEPTNSSDTGFELDVQEFVKELSAAYRTVIQLRYWQSMSYEGIAETLSIPIGTVRSRLNAARKQLLDKINKKENRHGG